MNWCRTFGSNHVDQRPFRGRRHLLVWRRTRLALLIPLLLALALASVAGAAVGDPTGQPARPAWAAHRDPVTIVTNGWIDVREILRTVATNSDLGLQMAPDVEGKVNVHLEKVAIEKALTALLEPVDLGYEVMDGVLVVYKRGMVTRWFTFDYPLTLREGRGELEISASATGSSGGGSSGESEGGTNKSHVTSSSVMSIWPEVTASLKVLVFQGMELPDGGDEDSIGASLSDTEGRSLVVNPMASLVQVTAEWSRVRQVEMLLTRLKESLQRQVAIEVRIMEVTLDEDTQTGVNWDAILRKSDLKSVSLSTFDEGDNIADDFLQFVVEGHDVSGVVQAIAATGDIRTVSTPRVTTLNNQKAVVRVVKEDVYYIAEVEPAVVTNGVATEPVISYTPVTFPVGVVLDVTPQVGRDRVVTLNVHPTISDVVGTAESPNQDTAPILSIREMDTVGKVRDGQTLVIAGLISERTKLTRSGIPVLKDLPLLGYLFGSTRNQKYNIELVMLLTPVITEGDAADAVAEATRQEMEGKM